MSKGSRQNGSVTSGKGLALKDERRGGVGGGMGGDSWVASGG